MLLGEPTHAKVPCGAAIEAACQGLIIGGLDHRIGHLLPLRMLAATPDYLTYVLLMNFFLDLLQRGWSML